MIIAGHDGYFAGYKPLTRYNDDALAKASALLNVHDIELRTGTRLVIWLTARTGAVAHETKAGRKTFKKTGERWALHRNQLVRRL